MFDFGRMISPITVESFFDEYWQQRPLIVRRQAPDYYAQLLNQRTVEQLIRSNKLKPSSVRVVKTESAVDSDRYTQPDGTLDGQKVLAEHKKGMTVVLNALQQHWAPLSQLCQTLQERFQRTVWTNIYSTPDSSQGFPKHYDTHDVFVLQVAGKKEWRIYDAPLPLPLTSQDHEFAYLSKAQLGRELTLDTGDLIYLPRGYVHEALTSGSSSIHITVGIDTYTWVDLFAAAFEHVAKQDVRFRHAVPMVSQASPASVQAQFKQLLNAFMANPHLEQAIQAQHSGRLLARARSSERLETQKAAQKPNVTAKELEKLTLTSLVKRKPGYYQLIYQDQAVALAYQDKQLKGPTFIEPALRYVLQHEQFEVSELPGHLKNSAKLVLTRRLLKEGLLTIERY